METPMCLLVFRYFAPFQNQSASKAKIDEKWTPELVLFTPPRVKIRDDMSESRF